MRPLRDLAPRLISALVLVVIALPLVVIGGPALAFLASVVGMVSWWEYWNLLRETPLRVDRLVGLIVLAVTPWLALLPPLYWILCWLLIPLVLMLGVLTHRPPERELGAVAGMALGLAWLLPGVFSAVAVRQWPDSGQGLLWLLLGVVVVVGSDTFAYFGGRMIGRHRFFPAISPKKTIEGAVAGSVAAVALAVAFGVFVLGREWWVTGLIGLAVAFSGMIGDLFESFLKRWCGKKDSGALLPGHGGLLDRIDSWLLALPVLLICVMLVTRG
ncbi:MAG: phosphatidate cytidylyltransferase [Chloroflexi bacterium]|nr:phosphatidate cytidylyltransferase [Chloroflexota bacterium]